MKEILCWFGLHIWKKDFVPTGTPDIKIGDWVNSFYMEGLKCLRCGKTWHK